MVNTKERIVKSTLAFATKFWWEVVRLRLFPTGGDNTLAEDRAILVASLVLGFPFNMGDIITEDMNYRVVKLSTSLPFPCLITRLCREAHVPILVGIDVETYATKVEEEMCIKEMRARVGGSSSISASRVDRYVTRATIHLESATLITSPLATEAAMPNPLSTIFTTKATIDGSGATPPKIVVPNSVA
ncbi:hypothetical protein HAX54_039144 [Datura stramonium]|uniref:Putative plant transposon protein domain-containing protein n=1 Tax=Datura stramonium TaxID=4076 RepID=A0ABS8RMZ9_DATST|nr:hypothetical protein [Datura stramonium]